VTDGFLRVNLNQPDFDNADRIARALNEQLGAGTATALDAATVRVKSSEDAINTVAKLGEVRLQPAVPARVVMNERTGTVIIGGAVRLASVAVAQGSLTVEIQTDYDVSQPLPRSPKAETVVVPDVGVKAKEQKSALVELKTGTTLAELVRALNALRVSPRDVIAIIQAIKTAGGLFAELEVQ
jgi:flagellar P-ring protein precursor FlgI